MRALAHALALVALVVLIAGAPALAAQPAPIPPISIVACAPGYPGTTAEAQPFMDALAASLARASASPAGTLAAVYLPLEAEGLARLRLPDAGVALVSLPFFLEHAGALGLTARLQVEVVGTGLLERWSLVAKKGRVARPADLAGLTIQSTAGYAPGFVRGALGGWGRIPDGAKVAQTTQVLSALRKAAAGGDVAVLVDGAQGEALRTLPFAAGLEVVARSEPVPAALVASVGGHLSAPRWAPLERALLGLAKDPAGAAALAGIRMARFAPLDGAALDRARTLAKGGAR